MARRQFVIDTGSEQIPVEGHEHRNVAIKYLMKRRRSLLMTKDQAKVEQLYAQVPQTVKIIGKQLTKAFRVTWERVGTQEFTGARFVFTVEEVT